MKKEDIKINTTMTRTEVYESDRDERNYYIGRAKTKSELKQNMKLPLTLEGCMTIFEMVADAMELPLDETLIQVFCGYLHHLPQTENSISFDVLMKVAHNHMSKSVTWELDQAVKDIRAKKAEAEKIQKLELVGETSAKEEATTSAEQPSPQ